MWFHVFKQHLHTAFRFHPPRTWCYAQNSCSWCIKVTQERCRVGSISTPALKNEVHMIHDPITISMSLQEWIQIKQDSRPFFHVWTSLTSLRHVFTLSLRPAPPRWPHEPQPSPTSLQEDGLVQVFVFDLSANTQQRNWIEAVNDCESLKSSVADSWNFI